MGFLKYLALFCIGIVLVYMFMGLLSFIPYFLGLIYGAFFFPINIISQVIYPVGALPYIVWVAGISLIFVLVSISIVTKGSKK